MTFTTLFGHEGHQEAEKKVVNQENISHSHEQPPVAQIGETDLKVMQWVGKLHFIFLHFPLALITMTVISELLFVWYKLPIYVYASRFMIISAAILAIPTALFGLIYSYTASYTGLMASFLWWHMWAGITVTAGALFAAFLREHYGTTNLYYTTLALLFLLINISGFTGGAMTFGT